ncbi:hypothetical protein HPB50_024141 [Hyalomma asiaticum]|uniref:Uncharacterized protein n=1 Tax=Hyalomma asiaticum TaxID=266040 RepID=A0ACB7TN34_HYAAI|nr:hypothetical protein HPB50_024141 [Hyalomma asiaticum]
METTGGIAAAEAGRRRREPSLPPSAPSLPGSTVSCAVNRGTAHTWPAAAARVDNAAPVEERASTPRTVQLDRVYVSATPWTMSVMPRLSRLLGRERKPVGSHKRRAAPNVRGREARSSQTGGGVLHPWRHARALPAVSSQVLPKPRRGNP